MKKLLSKSILVIVVLTFLTSCAGYHSGYMSDSAALSSANFSYISQNIQGESQATYVIGIGGLNKKTLVDTAKKQMLEASPLKGNQALVNLTVNFKSSYYLGFLVMTQKCIVTADVVEFK
ncbi:MAG: DUF6567 family protein [Flavobacterium sp.]|jgi:hypothetical protein